MALYQISLKSTTKWLIRCLIIYKRSEADCFRAQSQAQSTNTQTQTQTQRHKDAETNTETLRHRQKHSNMKTQKKTDTITWRDTETVWLIQWHILTTLSKRLRENVCASNACWVAHKAYTGLQGRWGQEASQAWKVPGLECVFLSITIFIITSVPSLSSLSRPRGSLAWNVSS